jgi:hypothetical protein
MDALTLRAWWAHKQGLDGTLKDAAHSTVLEHSGWARSVAGVNPYMTLFSRAGTSREAADTAVANLEIHELPAARGCTYVVPAADFALALFCGRDGAQIERKVAAKLGVTDTELHTLCTAIKKALKNGPEDPDGLRKIIGDASRSLGPEGAKKGITTTLPVGLGLLQSTGVIRRVPTNGRLDQQRYKYALWNLPELKITREEAATELARRFFRWIGPARLDEFQTFSGLGVKASQQAIAPLNLTTLEDATLLRKEDLENLHAFKRPKKPEIHLLASIDSLIHLHRTPAAVSQIAELPSHAIIDRGNVIGMWEYDPDAAKIVHKTFEKPPNELEIALKQTEDFIRDQLGDARSFSLDSPKSRAPRIAALQAS